MFTHLMLPEKRHDKKSGVIETHEDFLIIFFGEHLCYLGIVPYQWFERHLRVVSLVGELLDGCEVRF